MRLPLRNQIVWPMAAVMLSTVLAVSVTTASLAGLRAKSELERQFHDVARTVNDARFPLTEPVLLQMRGLSGAEFVLMDAAGQVLARTIGLPNGFDPHSVRETLGAENVSLEQGVSLENARYFHAIVRVVSRGASAETHALHIFYPEQNYQRAWRDAVLPPLAIGAAALIGMIALAVWIAGRVSRPLGTLHRQVEHIANGDFSPLPLPARDDEIRDLSTAVNRMAEMLTRYEADVRRTERLRTLTQLGGGIAHQLRNSATGCRMALDIHAAECPLGSGDESLSVAKRQLSLMENAIQRFLTLGKPKQDTPLLRLDLVEFIESVLPLVHPAARHADVELRWQRLDEPLWIAADAGELEQLVLNLLLNALDAARCQPDNHAPRWVEVACSTQNGRATLRVRDSGSGPAAAIQERLFEPFVTAKPDGVGLGLAVAQEIARRHGGEVVWDRGGDATCFRVDLPCCNEERS